MKTILLDCDGVMADFHTAYLTVFNDMFDRAVTKDQCTSWEFSDCICTPEEDEAVWAYFASTPNLVYELGEIPGAMEAVERLRSWARVVCVTSTRSRNRLWAGEREAWLIDRGFKKADIVQTSDKTHVWGDVLLDDGLHNIDAWGWRWKKPAVVFDQPYNQQEGRLRVFNWFRFEEWAEEYLR